jgi:hypothetical protein
VATTGVEREMKMAQDIIVMMDFTAKEDFLNS